MEIGCFLVGRLLASRPKVSLVVTPSMVMELKRLFCPAAEIEPLPLSVCVRRGSVRA